MRILIACHGIGTPGGPQTCVRDLALWLIEQGHEPVVYSSGFGRAVTSPELRRRGVPLTDSLATIAAAPDLIHGHSAAETMEAMLHFRDVPAIFTCHAASGWGSQAPPMSRVLRFVAVDDACRDRLVMTEGIDPSRVVVLLNATDLNRFAQRETLPEKPRRALVYSNLASELTYIAPIREACAAAGIELEIAGLTSGQVVDDPERLLLRYDLVFAKAKAALEALATGAAVILCDSAGLGEMVRAAEIPRLRRLNFGARSLTRELSAESIAREIERYHPAAAREASDVVRAQAGNDVMHASLFELYTVVLDEWRTNGIRDDAGEALAAASVIHSLAGQLYEGYPAGRMTRLFALVNASMRAPLIGRPLRWLAKRK